MSEGSLFARQLSWWMKGGGTASDIVVSSRLRLARNLDDVPFPPSMGRDDAVHVLEQAEAVADHLERSTRHGYRLFRLKDLGELDRGVLVEKHLLSPQIVNSAALSGVILREDEAVSVMVNEEDHLRIQCLFPGLNLEAAWELADEVDDIMSEVVRYGFDERLGYLSTCPTNLGTGMRASVMLHLPGLVMTEKLDAVISGITKVGAVVRGLYGEGSDAQGNLFQMSNRVTLGQSEQQITDNLVAVVNEVVQRERSAREKAMNRDRNKLEDRIYRAYGLLTNAKMMSSEEAMKLLSLVRLGVDLNIMSHVSPDVFQELIIRMRPSFIQSETGESLNAEERDIRRATLLRRRLQDG